MDGRAFLVVAQEVVTGTTAAHWRTAAVNAYYALLLECRDTLGRCGSPVPPRQTVHSYVRLRFVYATDRDLKQIGHQLEGLGQLRNRASYDLRSIAGFADATKAIDAIATAKSALTLLDTLDADPARRAAAIASLAP